MTPEQERLLIATAKVALRAGMRCEMMIDTQGDYTTDAKEELIKLGNAILALEGKGTNK